MLEFCRRIESEYKSGVAHIFLLHFNVDDLARDELYGYLPMMDYLMEQLNVMGCDIVIGYSPSRGAIWPNTEAWQHTQRLLGLRHGTEWADDEFVGQEPNPRSELWTKMACSLHREKAVGKLERLPERLSRSRRQ